MKLIPKGVYYEIVRKRNVLCAEYTIWEKKVCAIFRANAIDNHLTAWYNRIKIEQGDSFSIFPRLE